ncbi:MAG: RecQ family ATP-dependent DNA helicase [Chloroflexota bacterium]|nr:RecQ family ATP-dependent DNA helicase [Chloroflexota bacterium]
MATENDALAILRQGLGSDARFHDGQWEAIDSAVNRRERTLVVQRTGWGKSVVYFVATRLLRDSGLGPSLIISPLLALMRDQMRMATSLGIRAETLNSSNAEDWSFIAADLASDNIDLLLISPERLANDQFLADVLPRSSKGFGLVVVDEAHCISDWGHDFRPDYRRIVRILDTLPANIAVIATTATANDRVIADIEAQLGSSVNVQRGPLMRTSLSLQSIHLPSHAERLAWLADNLPELRKAGIIYTQTVADAQRVSAWLESRGFDAPAYYGSVASDTRVVLEERLRANDVDALVATSALGMGFDKPDLGFVIHYQRPGSLIAYYQQIGRAGRAIPEAHAILMVGDEDDAIQNFFIESAFPSEELCREILNSLASSEGLTTREIGAVVNAPYGRIDQALKILELEGAVSREERLYSRTILPWQPDHGRMAGITEQRRRELARIVAYSHTSECQMAFIARELDDIAATDRCGVCANCIGPAFNAAPIAATVRAAEAFLGAQQHRIRPRKMLPTGVLPDLARRIGEDLQMEEGRALSIWGDGGWSGRVRTGKYLDGYFSDDLVLEATRLITTRWQPHPTPTWVTSVPSPRRPDLVAGFAQRLADSLGLPYLEVLGHKTPPEEQKSMQNSAKQFLNIYSTLKVTPSRVQSGPVLLVDDMVDSSWTLTVCAAALRKRGSGRVFPFALASMPSGSDTP